MWKILLAVLVVFLSFGCKEVPSTGAVPTAAPCANSPLLGSYTNSFLGETLTFTDQCILTASQCGTYTYENLGSAEGWETIQVEWVQGGSATNSNGESCPLNGLHTLEYLQPSTHSGVYIGWDWEPSEPRQRIYYAP